MPGRLDDPDVSVQEEVCVLLRDSIYLVESDHSVQVTYSVVSGQAVSVQLDDTVQWHESHTASPTSSRKTIRGTDKRDQNPPADGANWQDSGTRWQWRGKGFLAVATSRFQVLGYHLHSPSADDEPEWMVIMPSASTRFGRTPTQF
jgi:hypothetical protein